MDDKKKATQKQQKNQYYSLKEYILNIRDIICIKFVYKKTLFFKKRYF